MNIYIYIYNLTIQKKKKRKLLATNWYSRPILIRFGQNIFSLLLLYIWKENVDNSSQTCIYRLNIVKNKVMLFLGHAFFGYSFNTILWGGGGGTQNSIFFINANWRDTFSGATPKAHEWPRSTWMKWHVPKTAHHWYI